MNEIVTSKNSYIEKVIKQMILTTSGCVQEPQCGLPALDSSTGCYKHAWTNRLYFSVLKRNKNNKYYGTARVSYYSVSSYSVPYKSILVTNFMCHMCNKSILPDIKPIIDDTQPFDGFFYLSALHPTQSKRMRPVGRLVHFHCYQELLSNQKLIAVSTMLSR